MKYFNFDYFAVFKEAGITKQCAFRIKRIKECNNGKILFIVPCLIGDFVATLPAIINFMEKYREKTFDIVVTPNIKVLAEKIVRIGHVYTPGSIVKRKKEIKMIKFTESMKR